MKLYFLVNVYGTYHTRAFTDLDRAQHELVELSNSVPNHRWVMKRVDLPFIGRSVCYVNGYYGFDYDLGGTKGIYHIERRSNIYASQELAKSDKIWQDAEKRVRLEGSAEYVINDDMIASIDNHFGTEPEIFIFGDCMQNKFNVRINRIRVIKETGEEYLRFLAVTMG